MPERELYAGYNVIPSPPTTPLRSKSSSVQQPLSGQRIVRQFFCSGPNTCFDKRPFVLKEGYDLSLSINKKVDSKKQDHCDDSANSFSNDASNCIGFGSDVSTDLHPLISFKTVNNNKQNDDFSFGNSLNNDTRMMMIALIVLVMMLVIHCFDISTDFYPSASSEVINNNKQDDDFGFCNGLNNDVKNNVSANSFGNDAAVSNNEQDDNFGFSNGLNNDAKNDINNSRK
ncbi:2769_t:CDS:2 [Cetraspora pellucida]|uniref:2769_t:CDS:1 n=1 Tax=Cetraspora pellucida TaxID=1433469 RepID=A0ACA9KVY5_9GLOM|nr:2769_t:CDS:2 [Cetraspora pellucida]